MDAFLERWGEAALTTLGYFWMALWAFALGYTISSLIQVFVTRERMKRVMGEAGPKSVALATFFGFVSSSCSFAALSTARSLFQKGAGLVPALAFLLASTNLVIELGILIFVFLAWPFVLGEYLGGLLLILCMWLIVRLTLPKALVEAARKHAKEAGQSSSEGEIPDWKALAKSREGWRRVGRRYFMEWNMVWKDVTFGFTVAGVIAAFVPPSFFQTLFIGSGAEGGPAWWEIALHTVIGPVAAFFTFIGSMGNIPLAAILFGSGVSFAGVMAFIFSDLVVFPVLRISARFFGVKMALYILGVFFASLVATSLVLHYSFDLLGIIPEPSAAQAEEREPSERFGLDYTFWLNLVFVGLSLLFAWFGWSKVWRETSGEDGEGDHDHDHGETNWVQRVLSVLTAASILWLLGGVLVSFIAGGGPGAS